jgi:hypothetical protein
MAPLMAPVPARTGPDWPAPPHLPAAVQCLPTPPRREPDLGRENDCITSRPTPLAHPARDA